MTSPSRLAGLPRPNRWLAATLALSGVAIGGARSEDRYREVVRPILERHCFTCHGPDENDRKGKFRIDTFEGATGSGKVIPGSPDKSEMIYRITTDDPDDMLQRAIAAVRHVHLSMWQALNPPERGSAAIRCSPKQAITL